MLIHFCRFFIFIEHLNCISIIPLKALEKHMIHILYHNFTTNYPNDCKHNRIDHLDHLIPYICRRQSLFHCCPKSSYILMRINLSSSLETLAINYLEHCKCWIVTSHSLLLSLKYVSTRIY